METITKSAQETCRLGASFADYLKKEYEKKKGARVIALVGNLGSGKTTFVQCVARALGITQRTISPTFVIMRKYQGRKFCLYHVDLYRIGVGKEEFLSLGIPDLWKQDGNIIMIEWAEKIREFLPKDTIWINFEVISEEKRRIRYENIY